MAYDFKAFEFGIFTFVDAAFFARDFDLFVDRVYRFEIRQKQAAPVSLCHDDAVAFYVERFFRRNFFRARKDVDAVDER